MAEVTIYLARAMVVFFVYLFGSAGVKLGLKSHKHLPEHGKLLLGKVCPTQLKHATKEAFGEVVTVAIAVAALHAGGIL